MRQAQDLGDVFGPLSAREVDYLISEEWAQTPEDILWRRSKLGLHMSPAEQSALEAHLSNKAGNETRRKISAH